MVRRVRFGLFLSIALCTVVGAGADENPAAWRNYVRGDREYELKRSFAGKQGTTWLLIGTRAMGKLGGDAQELELRRVDAQGAIGEPIAIAGRSSLDPVATLVGESVVVAVSTSSGVEITWIGEQSRAVQARKTIPATSRDLLATAVVPLTEGALLLVGRSGSDPWMAKLSAGLDVLWNHVLADAPAAVLEDAVGLKDGSFVVTGADVEGEKASIWVASFDKEAKPRAQTTFPGLQSRITADGNGFVVIHDRQEGNWDIWARGFSSALEPRWERRIATGGDLPPSFEVRNAPGGGWLTTFGSEQKVNVIAGRADAIEWSHSEPALSQTWESVWNVGSPVVSNGQVVFPYTLLSVNESGEQRQIVGVTKLKVD